MELKDLVGKHVLTGVDRQLIHENYENSDCFNFVLDGVTYSAIEDPDDGYRSTMREIKVSSEKVINTFDGIEVLARMESNGECGTKEILELIDTKNGNTILEVGTDYSDSYYPTFVAYWSPEDMSANH